MTPPLARRDDLLVEDLGDETVVYDLLTGRAHALSRTTATVWRHCDGRHEVEALALRAGAAADIGGDAVALALEQLQAAGLLVGPAAAPAAAAPDGLSRRHLIQGLHATAAAGVLLPTLHSVVVPSAAAAQPADACCTGASLLGDTVSTNLQSGNNTFPPVTSTVGVATELVNAGPALGLGPAPRWNINFGANTIRINFVGGPQTYGAGLSFNFSDLNPRVPPGCPAGLVPRIVGASATTDRPASPFVTATFTPTSLIVAFAPNPGSAVWIPGQSILVTLQYGCDVVPPIPPPIDPCCPPWNPTLLAEMMVYQGSGGIAAPFTLRFQPTAALNTMMKAYVAYLQAVNPAITNITIHFALHSASDGTGTGQPCVRGPQFSANYFETWTPTSGPVPVPNFFPPSSMLPNQWYVVHTGIFLNNNLTFFPVEECSVSQICVRLQVLPRAASDAAAGGAVLQIRTGDGSIIERQVAGR